MFSEEGLWNALLVEDQRGGPQNSDRLLRWLQHGTDRSRSHEEATEVAPEFKAKVALEALSGELTLAEFATKYDVHPNLVQQWKRHAKESMADLFSGKATAHQQKRDADIKELHAKIGELTVERDFLSKAFGSSGVDIITL
jgi:transposase